MMFYKHFEHGERRTLMNKLCVQEEGSNSERMVRISDCMINGGGMKSSLHTLDGEAEEREHGRIL